MLHTRLAVPEDARHLAQLHSSVAIALADRYGRGPWSAGTTEKGILFAMRSSVITLVFNGDALVGTFRLTTRKPWAIDPTRFRTVQRPVYLLAMAVHPEQQRKGIGRWSLTAAETAARSMDANAIRLDAYDAEAGAGGFYERCGFSDVGRAIYRNVPLRYFERMLSDRTSTHSSL